VRLLQLETRRTFSIQLSREGGNFELIDLVAGA
jgi:hypothetical protein